MDNIEYQNAFCRIVSRGTIYVLQSKSGKYNDQYFQTLDAAKRSIGIIPNHEKYTFQL
jgi:hypothetical protein